MFADAKSDVFIWTSALVYAVRVFAERRGRRPPTIRRASLPRLDICAMSGYNYNNYIFRRMRKVSEVIMEQKKIDRINELARKSKAEGLTEAEKAGTLLCGGSCLF